MTSTSPLPVKQRDIHFPIASVRLRDWHPAGTHVSQIFNGQSLFFPDGEQFFIDTVRHYRDRITDPKLKEDVKGFIGQEAMHGREHRAYNQALAEAGYPAAELERKAIRQLNRARKLLTPAGQLGVTIALEHFTAILADAMLNDDSVLEGAPPEMQALWRWHAIEETEHKAVAFDVYQAVVGKGILAYLRRCLIMLVASIQFIWQTNYTVYQLTKHDGLHHDWRGWLAMWRFQYVRPGTLRKIALPWLSYFRPGFHPWQHDNRHHVERWKAQYGSQQMV
jgi:predicted metal-dependent hydrolase